MLETSKELYKISFVDNNCPSFITFKTDVYVWNIDEYLKKLSVVLEKCYRGQELYETLKEIRDKREYICDTEKDCTDAIKKIYSFAPSITVYKDVSIMHEESIEYNDKKVSIYNSWGYPDVLCINNIKIKCTYVHCKDNENNDIYRKLGEFEIKGGYRKFKGRQCMRPLGNPTIDGEFPSHEEMMKVPLKKRFNLDETVFKDDRLTSICLIPCGTYTSMEEMNKDIEKNHIDKRDWDILLADIAGE